MMELTCIFVLTIISLATSTPHGYGVKSGGLANAQAGATAGAYAGSPQFNAPSGAGISGSFTKASSSSFAGSSASSSASSFSYSGAGGYSGSEPNKISPGSGCTTGACQNGGAGENLSPTGAGNNAFSQSGAVAGSASQAGAQQYNEDGSPCNGDCSNKPAGCIGLNCGSNTKKCASGHCADNNSDDIYVNAGSKKPTSNDYNNKYPKYPSASTTCSTGNCGPSSISQPEDDGSYKPEQEDDSSYKHDYDDSFKSESENSYKPSYSPSLPGVYPSSTTVSQLPPSKPSIFISLPKDTSPTGSLYSANLPSSYNVPIHASVPGNIPQGSGPKCVNGNCDNNSLDAAQSSSDSNSVSTNHVIGSPQKGIEGPKCNTPGCDTTTLQKDYPNFVPLQGPKISSQGNSLSGAVATYPGYPHGGIPASHSPTESVPSNCASGNCGGFPSAPPSSPNSPNYNTPSHTSGNGCPSGNCGGTPSAPPSNHISSNYGSHTSLNGCAHGNCGTYPSAHANAGAAIPPLTIEPNKLKQPIYNGGFGGPSGYLKPNDYSVPSKTFTAPQPTPAKPYYPTSLPQGIPSVVQPLNQGIHKQPSVSLATEPIPSNCVSGNCGGIPSTPPSSPNSPNYSIVPPTAPANGCASGNCGNVPFNPKVPSYHVPSGNPPTGPAPSNCVSGNCGGIPSASHSNPNSPNYSVPSNAAPANGCPSGNCGTLPFNSEVPSYNALSSSPPTGLASSNCVSGNCGGIPSSPPSNPNYGVPSHTAHANACPSGICGNVPFNSKVPSYNTPNCVSGNCDSTPSAPPSSHNSPNYGSQTSSNGCTHGICGAYPSAHANAGAAITPLTTGPNKSKLPIYNGGFGGPSGFLKPNDYSVPSKIITSPQATPAKPYYPTSSPQGTPSVVSPFNQGVHKQPSVLHTPSTLGPSVPQYNQAGTLSNAVAGAVATASATAYTGGFGGPSGVLKPFDDGKGGQTGAKHQASLSTANESPHGDFTHALGSSGSYGNAMSAAVSGAQAGSLAGAFNGGYGSQESHGDKKNGSGGCNSGCESSGNFGSLHPVGGSGKSLGGTGAGATAGAYSFASASAHASSGAATKGGYGRR